jgi:aryl-alcohol dehydrogenase-like predicted oxidoreductase
VALAPDQLRQAVRDNLTNLGLETLDVVNLRIEGFSSPTPGSLAEPYTTLAEMQQEGLIRHLGLSTVIAEQVAEAQSIAPVVCVQNFYNIANCGDDALVDSLAEQGIASVPYFPLGGFTPLQSDTLSRLATRLHASPMAVALAWLLQRSPNILLIPGTSSAEHLRENVAGAALPPRRRGRGTRHDRRLTRRLARRRSPPPPERSPPPAAACPLPITANSARAGQ